MRLGISAAAVVVLLGATAMGALRFPFWSLQSGDALVCDKTVPSEIRNVAWPVYAEAGNGVRVEAVVQLSVPIATRDVPARQGRLLAIQFNAYKSGEKLVGTAWMPFVEDGSADPVAFDVGFGGNDKFPELNGSRLYFEAVPTTDMRWGSVNDRDSVLVRFTVK